MTWTPREEIAAEQSTERGFGIPVDVRGTQNGVLIPNYMVDSMKMWGEN